MLCLDPPHQCTHRTDIHAAHAPLAVIVIKTFVHHHLPALKFSLSKLKHHIRAGRIAQPAVDTPLFDKNGQISLSGRRQVCGHCTAKSWIHTANRRCHISPFLTAVGLLVPFFFTAPVLEKVDLCL